MECILLGSGGMMPLPNRLLTALAVRLDGRTYLFDAGEGAQIGWKKAQLGLRGFSMLAVTHLHADHCLGIPGLLMLRAQMDDPSPLTVVGPPGIKAFIEESRQALGFRLNYSLQFIEWSNSTDGLAYQDSRIRLFWQPLKHTLFCLGYRLEERERPGKFNPHRAVQLGIPKGSLWGKLQAGQDIVLDNGHTIGPGQVLGPARRGRHLAYVVDTRPAKPVYNLCHNADIAFIEGMFSQEHVEHANTKGHLTVVEAAKIARRAEVKKAVLVHISPRYSDEDLAELQEEALAAFEKAVLGRDLAIYSVAYGKD